MIEGKKPEIVKLKSLAEELKEGVPDIDENYLNEQLADLDSTVAILAKSCAKHQQELEDGLQRSNNFYAKLEEALANVKQKKEELAKISPAGLDISSVKSKLDELNVSVVEKIVKEIECFNRTLYSTVNMACSFANNNIFLRFSIH